MYVHCTSQHIRRLSQANVIATIPPLKPSADVNPYKVVVFFNQSEEERNKESAIISYDNISSGI